MGGGEGSWVSTIKVAESLLIVNFHMHVCDMLADQKCQSHNYSRHRTVNPARLQMLRIDREGIIDDVIMHGT